MSSALTCAQCATEFPQPPRTRGKVQRYCSKPCQTKAANMRRATTRAGRINGVTYPQAGKAPIGPLHSTLTDTHATVDRAATETPHTPSDRLSELMEKAHSRGGVTAWEIAEIAKLRGRSPWSPLRVILAP
jgi:hypothetical protein